MNSVYNCILEFDLETTEYCMTIQLRCAKGKMDFHGRSHNIGEATSRAWNELVKWVFTNCPPQ